MTEKGTVSWKTLCPTWALVMDFLLSPLLTASLGTGPGRSRQNCSIKGVLKLALSSLGGPSTSRPLTAQGLPTRPVSPRKAESVVPGALRVGGKEVQVSSGWDETPKPGWQILVEVPVPEQGSSSSLGPTALEVGDL